MDPEEFAILVLRFIQIGLGIVMLLFSLRVMSIALGG